MRIPGLLATLRLAVAAFAARAGEPAPCPDRLQEMALLVPFSDGPWGSLRLGGGGWAGWTRLGLGSRAGLDVESRIRKGLRVRLAGGAEFARHYEFENEGRIELDEPVDDTWFAHVALAVY